MKIVKLHILSLVVGALVAGGQASAGPADEAAYEKTWQFARLMADQWRDEIKEAFEKPHLKHEAYLKAMQNASEKVHGGLVGMQCRDGAQAKQIEDYIHGRFHTLYGRVVADIKHGVDLNCRNHELAVTFWITDFTPTAAMIAAVKSAEETEKMDAAAKRMFGNWSTAVLPVLSDKSKKIEDIRAWATRMSEQLKSQVQTIACPEGSFALTLKGQAGAGMNALSDNFTGYKFDITCSGKKLTVVYDFANLKRKGS